MNRVYYLKVSSGHGRLPAGAKWYSHLETRWAESWWVHLVGWEATWGWTGTMQT